MSDLSLRLRIANREYPMKVKEAEEQNVRKAAAVVNERVKAFRGKFGIEDKQDLLAMVAFDCTIKSVREKSNMDDDETLQKIQTLNQMIEQALAD